MDLKWIREEEGYRYSEIEKKKSFPYCLMIMKTWNWQFWLFAFKKLYLCKQVLMLQTRIILFIFLTNFSDILTNELI